MFVTPANFDGIKYNLPKLDDYGSNAQAFIDEVEEEALRCLLGNELYTEFIEGLEETYPLQKWTDLAEGVVFDVDGVQLVWVGMEKMLTPLVYSKLIELTHRKHTGIGASISKFENAMGINPVEDVVRGNNDYVDQAYILAVFLKNSEDYDYDLDFSYTWKGRCIFINRCNRRCFPQYRNTFGI